MPRECLAKIRVRKLMSWLTTACRLKCWAPSRHVARRATLGKLSMGSPSAMWPISTRVDKAENDDAAVLEPVESESDVG
jgi:hypothetical protein